MATWKQILEAGNTKYSRIMENKYVYKRVFEKSRNGKQKELICMYLRATVGEQTLDSLLFICVTCFVFFISSSVVMHKKTLMYTALSINGSFFVYSNI
jgi:hypothetical protein